MQVSKKSPCPDQSDHCVPYFYKLQEDHLEGHIEKAKSPNDGARVRATNGNDGIDAGFPHHYL